MLFWDFLELKSLISYYSEGNKTKRDEGLEVVWGWSEKIWSKFLCVHWDQPTAKLRTNLSESGGLFPLGRRPSQKACLQLQLLSVLCSDSWHRSSLMLSFTLIESAPKRPRGLLPCPCALIAPLKLKVMARDTWDCSSHRERPYKDQSLSAPCPLSGPIMSLGICCGGEEMGQDKNMDKNMVKTRDGQDKNRPHFGFVHI